MYRVTPANSIYNGIKNYNYFPKNASFQIEPGVSVKIPMKFCHLTQPNREVMFIFVRVDFSIPHDFLSKKKNTLSIDIVKARK